MSKAALLIKKAVAPIAFTSLLSISGVTFAQELAPVLDVQVTSQAASTAPTAPTAPNVVSVRAVEKKGALKRFTASAGELAMHAMGLLGIQYKYGGNTPESGLDCSGFVRYVFKQASGEDLPRTSRELNKIGTKVATHDLVSGDLVFFRTVKNAVSHVGIYLGGDKFIHSPSAGGEVRVESMAGGYWKKKFAGGRRVIDAGTL